MIIHKLSQSEICRAQQCLALPCFSQRNRGGQIQTAVAAPSASLVSKLNIVSHCGEWRQIKWFTMQEMGHVFACWQINHLPCSRVSGVLLGFRQKGKCLNVSISQLNYVALLMFKCKRVHDDVLNRATSCLRCKCLYLSNSKAVSLWKRVYKPAHPSSRARHYQETKTR